MILVASGLKRRFGGLLATDDVSLSVDAGELHAVIGPNGAGKSTLINLLSGQVAPHAGSVQLAGRDITREPVYRRALAGLGRSHQQTSVFLEFTALENVMLAMQAHSGHSFACWRPARSEGRLVDPAQDALERVGLASSAERYAGALAHGQRRQLELAMALVARPKLLLLDEPMAGMSEAESRRMVDLLHSLKRSSAMLLVEHDMRAVFALADNISVLVQGRILASGRPEEIRADIEVRRAYLGDDVEAL